MKTVMSCLAQGKMSVTRNFCGSRCWPYQTEIMVEGLEVTVESWNDWRLSGMAMGVVCGLVLARRECWRWRGGSDLPQRRRLQKNEGSRKHPWQVAETLIGEGGSLREPVFAKVC